MSQNELCCEEQMSVMEDCPKEIERSKGALLSDNEVRIRFVSVGCIISVGCKTFAFSTVNEGIKALVDYVENPIEEYKKWINLTN